MADIVKVPAVLFNTCFGCKYEATAECKDECGVHHSGKDGRSETGDFIVINNTARSRAKYAAKRAQVRLGLEVEGDSDDN